MTFTPNTGMNLLSSQGADNVVLINENLGALDVMCLPRVVNRANSSPPSATAGDAFIVLGTGSGAWTGHDGHIAWWNGSAWRYVSAEAGSQVYCVDEKCVLTKGSGSAWSNQSPCAEASFRKNASSSAVTTDAGVAWDVSQLSLTNSRVFEFDAGNPTRIKVNETGDYEVSAQVTFSASSTAAWNSMQARLQTSSDGSSWTDVTDSSAFGPVRPTDVPQHTVPVLATVNLVAPTYLRVVVNRASGSSTVVVTANTRMRVRKVR